MTGIIGRKVRATVIVNVRFRLETERQFPYEIPVGELIGTLSQDASRRASNFIESDGTAVIVSGPDVQEVTLAEVIDNVEGSEG